MTNKPDKPKPKRSRDYSQYLLWAALLVTVPRYIGAFVASDSGEITGWLSEILTGLMAVSGIGMGILDILGMAYVFDGWRTKLGKASGNTFKVLTGFVIALAASSVFILAPFTMARVKQVSISAVLPDMWLLAWALVVNVSPLLLIGGVVVGQAGVVGITHATDATNKDSSKDSNKDSDAEQKRIMLEQKVKLLEQQQQQELAKTEQEAAIAVFCPRCSSTFKNRQAYAAHACNKKANANSNGKAVQSQSNTKS